MLIQALLNFLIKKIMFLMTIATNTGFQAALFASIIIFIFSLLLFRCIICSTGLSYSNKSNNFSLLFISYSLKQMVA